MKIGRYEILPNITYLNNGKKYQITSIKKGQCTKRWYFNNYKELFIFALKAKWFQFKLWLK